MFQQAYGKHLQHMRLAHLLQAVNESVVLQGRSHLPLPVLVHVQQPPQVAGLQQ